MDISTTIKCAEDNNLWAIKNILTTHSPQFTSEEDKRNHFCQIRRLIHVAMWSNGRTGKRGCMNKLEDFIRTEILHLT